MCHILTLMDLEYVSHQGIYTSYTVGAGDQSVKFILVDNRYNRDSYDTPDGDLLGAAQWTWLENELMGSTAAFNVIVSGIQVLPNDRFDLAESWSRFPNQRERLLQLILASKAKGVILLRYCTLQLFCITYLHL